MNRFILASGLVGSLAVGLQAADNQLRPDLGKLPAPAAGVMDFQRDIKPIFATRCVACHGPAKQKAGLRLDNSAAALKGRNSGPVIKPGDAVHSRLLTLA